MEPVKVDSPAGIYRYMCTRNNNFSNRDQKGNIVVYTKGQMNKKEAQDRMALEMREFDETLDNEAHDDVEMGVRERSILTLLEGLAEGMPGKK